MRRQSTPRSYAFPLFPVPMLKPSSSGSYHDLSVRLEPIIFELERDRSDLLIIAHASVLRCLFAYLKGLAPQDIPAVDIARGDL